MQAWREYAGQGLNILNEFYRHPARYGLSFQLCVMASLAERTPNRREANGNSDVYLVERSIERLALSDFFSDKKLFF